MAQYYSNPARETDPYALPDLEVFYVSTAEIIPNNDGGSAFDDAPISEIGWYWQACFPGCLPDGDPVGPFDTEADALADAREGDDETGEGA